MTVRTEFPRPTRLIRDAVIPLSDGVRLSAQIWLPEDAEADPVPAILEYLPYRKRDGTSDRDALTHPYFAGHGYACVRVDMRGSGDSEGVLLGEYLKQEQDDALEILRWIAAQPWSTGAVGMIGISWGGFNGLQIAARRPPELKAVISLCSTDDRYADDIHFMGGQPLVDKLSWGSTMFAINATPPDPALVGDRWRDLWMGRLEGSGFWLEEWFARQRRDAFYKHGSICEDYSAVQCPVWLVGGWADGYTNPIFRMMEKLSCPKKALVGPWAHKYAHFANPGPRIGFLQESLRWWDQWLKGVDTGVMEEPALRIWRQDSAPPRRCYAERPGRWIAEAAWPSANVRRALRPLGPGALLPEGARSEGTASICSPQTVGLEAGVWCPYGLGPDQAGDQRAEAGGSLVFDGEALTAPLDILGAVEVRLRVASDRPTAFVAATLSEVAPDGAATRLTYGVLNLAHRDSHEDLKPLVPGRFVEARVKLNDCAQRLSPGSRLRLALSTAYWPIVWPAPEPVTLTVDLAASALDLPVRVAGPLDASLKPLPPAETAAPIAKTELRPGAEGVTVAHDHATGVVTLERVSDDGLQRYDAIDWEVRTAMRKRLSIRADDPLSAGSDILWEKEYGRGDWRVHIRAATRMRLTVSHFVLTATLDAFEGETRVFSKEWACEIPRDCC